MGYNNLKYFIITVAAYEGVLPSPLRDNYPIYESELDEDGNQVLKTGYSWKDVNESDNSRMWAFPKTMDYGSGETIAWIGKENKEQLWTEEDIAAINAISGCECMTHEEITKEFTDYLVEPKIV